MVAKLFDSPQASCSLVKDKLVSYAWFNFIFLCVVTAQGGDQAQLNVEGLV